MLWGRNLLASSIFWTRVASGNVSMGGMVAIRFVGCSDVNGRFTQGLALGVNEAFSDNLWVRSRGYLSLHDFLGLMRTNGEGLMVSDDVCKSCGGGGGGHCGAGGIFSSLGGGAMNVFHFIDAALWSHLLGVVGRGHLKGHDGVVGEKRLVISGA